MWDYIQQNIWIKDSIASVFVIFGVWLVSYLVDRALRQTIKDPQRLFTAKKVNRYVSIFIILVLLLLVWFQFAHSFVTFVGLFTAGVAIALREVFASIAAWIYLVTNKPFTMGDRILVNGHRGDVIDIRVLQFSLAELAGPEGGEQSTGAIVDLPNHLIFSHPTINQTKNFPYIWNEMDVKLSLQGQWQEAKEVFLEILVGQTKHFQEEAQEVMEQASQSVGIFYNVLTPTVYLDVQDQTIVLTLRYLCPARLKRPTRQAIWLEILAYAQQHPDIQLIGG